jgi:CheY-like chemotaxis protein
LIHQKESADTGEQSQERKAPCVLIVDDHISLLVLFRKVFGASGFKVETARNGNEGYKLLEQKHVDVIVCDLMMPEMDGYELLKQVRKDERLRDIPFVVLSVKDKLLELEIAMKLGADDFVEKYASPKEIVERVTRLITKENEAR